jgi:hypothetical protein
MTASVIIPYEFSSADNFKHDWRSEKVEAGMLKRYFLKLPGGQSIMHVALNSQQSGYALIRYRLCDPDGHQIEVSPTLTTTGNNTIIEKNYYNLNPGVYELIVEGMLNNNSASTYDLSVSFNSVRRVDNNRLSLKDKEIEVVNYFNQPQTYSVTGKISGYCRSYKADLSGKLIYKYPFTLKNGESEKGFDIILSKEDFNKTTDFTFEIVDSAGLAIEKDGLSYRQGNISLLKKDGKKGAAYTLLIIPAFTNAADSMSITIKEETEFDSPKEFSVKGTTANNLSLYPSITKPLYLDYSKPETNIPSDAGMYGQLIFQSSGKTIYELPVEIDLK